MIIKNIFNRYLALAMTFVFTSAAVWAAEPVAVWSQDFSNLTHDDFTISGGAVSSDHTTISSSSTDGAILITASAPEGEFNTSIFSDKTATIIIEYADFAYSTNIPLLGVAMHQQDGTYMAGVSSVAANGAKGVWQQPTTYGMARNGNSRQEAELTGSDYRKLAVAYANVAGTGYSQGTTAYVNEVKVYQEDGLRGTNLVPFGFAIGGLYNYTGVNPAGVAGMTVRAIAIFDKKLTDAEVAEYVFPEPPAKQTQFMKFYYPLDGDATNLGSASDEGLLTTDGTPAFETKAPFGSKSLKAGNSTDSNDFNGSYILADTENGLATYETGWSFTFWFNSNDAYQWRDVCGFDIGSVSYKFQKTGNDSLQMYNSTGSVLPDITGHVIPYTAGKWINITVVSKDEDHFSIYAGGTKILDYPLDTYQGETKVWGEGIHALTKLIMGAKGTNGARASTALTSDYAIYDYQLSEEQIGYLASSIPVDFGRKGWDESPNVIAVNFNATAKNNNEQGGDESHKLLDFENANIPGITVFGSMFEQVIDKSGTLTDEESGLTITWSSNNNFMYRDSLNKIIRGYLDDGGNKAQVDFTNIPFNNYDVIIIFATDTENKKFSPCTINNEMYTWDEDSKATIKTTEATKTWGYSRADKIELGLNALKVSNLHSSMLSIVGGANANNARGGVAGIVIVEVPAEELHISGNLKTSELASQIPERAETVIINVDSECVITHDSGSFAAENLVFGAESSTSISFTLSLDDLMELRDLPAGEEYDFLNAIFGMTPTFNNIELSVGNLPDGYKVVSLNQKLRIVKVESANLFTLPNTTDWADLTLPVYTRTFAAQGNKSFASDAVYRQMLGEREATVVNVTDAPANSLIYALHAFSGQNGLGNTNRDFYLMVSGGTPGVISGGEDAAWGGTKTVLQGNVLLNILGNTTVDYVYGEGLGGGSAVTNTGDIGIVIDGEAQVLGSIVGGWQSRHNSVPALNGNISILVKNVQTHAADATITANSVNCIQGYIVGGGIFMTNGGRSSVNGNTLVEIRLPEGAKGEFMKHIVGAGHAEGGGDGNNVTGNSVVVISAPDSVIFSKDIMGGGHSTGTYKAKVGGSSSVTINGGTFSGTIYAAGDNAEHTLVTGSATLTINGGDLSEATLKGGNATEGTTLDISGGKIPLGRISGFNTVNISSMVTLVFPDGQTSDTLNSIDATTLTFDGETSGTHTITADIMIGSLVREGATVEIDLDNKTIKFSVDTTGALVRRSDADLEADESEKTWTAAGSWYKISDSEKTPCDWEDGATDVVIDADKVSKIIVDGQINVGMVVVSNTATEEGSEFSFETLEDLGQVGTSVDNPDYIINGKVSAADFAGKLYLQARISDSVACGPETRVIFVSGIDETKSDEENAAEVTTAYSYTFSNLAHPIGKIGLGTFVVPSSMYKYPFNVDNGKLRYQEGGEITGAITADQGSVVIDAGENIVTLSGQIDTDVIIRSGTLKLNAANAFGTTAHTVTVEEGGTLDLNGRALNGVTVLKISGSGAAGHPYAVMNSASGNATLNSFSLLADATIGGTGNIAVNGTNNGLNLQANEYKLIKAGTGLIYTSSVTITGTAGIDIKEGGYRVDAWNNHLREGTLHVYSGAYFQHNNDRAYEVKNVILDEGAQIRGATSSRYLKISGELNIPGNTELNHYIMLNGAAIKGSGTLKLVEGGTLVVGTATTSSAALMLTKTGTLTLNAAISFPTLKLAADYSAAEIDGIANLSFDTIELTEGATLDMTAKIRYPYYTLGATQNGKIKITTPTSRKRIAEVVAGYTSGITLVDENGEELDSCVYGGYLYYGTLCTDTEVSADEIAANVVYPSNTTVNGVDVDHYSVNDGKGGIAVATKTDSISINFGVINEIEGMVELADTDVGACPVSGASWNNALSNLKDGKGELTTLAVTIDNVGIHDAANKIVNSNKQLNGNQKLTYGYIDNTEDKTWSVTLVDIPYNKFDLYLISASNGEVGEDGTILSLPYQLIVDGSYKYYGSSVVGTPNSTWNVAPYCEESMVEGKNYIKISFAAKPETLKIMYPMTGIEGVATLAAIQIVEDKSEGSGIYTRKEGFVNWTDPGSWETDGVAVDWPISGKREVVIDANTVSSIVVDDIISADSVTVTGEGEFRFLTKESLVEVADDKPDAPYRLDAQVSLTGFRGDIYLQSRITDEIQLGEHAQIVFVAMEAGKETTAYQYKLNGTIAPIRKIGPGTFVVPSSMYANIPFNITAGNICYDYDGESPVTIGGALSGSGNIVKRGAGTIKLGVANNEFGGSLFVNEGAVDFGGKWLNNGKGYTVVTQAGAQLTNTGDANSNAAIIKSLTLEGDTTINGNSLGIGCGNDDVATAINLGANTLTLATTGHSYLRKTTISGNGKLVVSNGVRLIVYQNPVTAAEATLEIAAGSSRIELQGDNSALTVKNLSLNGTLTMPESGTRSITVTDTISGSGSIPNLTLQDGATVELGKEGVITVTGTLAFGNTLKIKGGAFDKEAFAFTTEPTSLPSNVILVNDEGAEKSGYCFNVVNGKLVIASNEAQEISRIVNVSDLLPLSTTRMKLTGDTVFVIDTAEGMPSAINFIAEEACNLAFIYAAPYTGTLTFGDNITVEKKYAPEAWSLVPATIGPGPIVTIIGYDTQEEADAAGNDFSSAITVQEGGVLHLERLIKLSAANNVNQGGTLEIVEDTTPGAPATFAKVRLADRGMKGTLNIGKNTTYYPFGYPDQPDYDHSTTVINVYGTLDMSDNSNARWTLRSGITINFYVGSQAVGDGQENASHHSAFQFNRDDCVLNFLKDGATGGEIDFNLRLRPEHVFTMNIEEDVIVNMGGKLDTGHSDNQPFLLAGDGSVVIKGEYAFGAPLEDPEGKVTIAEGGSLSVKSWLDYEFNENRTSIGTDTNSLSRDNNGNGFSEADELKILSVDNKALYTATAPYRSVDYPGNWTAAIYGTLPRLANGVYVGFGNTSAGLALVNGEENVVKVAKMSGNTQFTTIIDVLVPEAHTKDHLYALVRTTDSVELYVDGMLRGKYNETVTMNGGMQIGGVYQGVLNSGLVKFTKDAFGGNVNNPTLRASHIDILRVYKSALGPHANETLAKEMSYTLPGGSYKRVLTETETYSWEQEGAWEKGEESASKPAELSEVEISVPDENVSAAIKLTETTNIGSLKISGKGMLGIVAENEGVLVNYGDTIIDGVYASVKYGAVDFTHGGISLLNKGAIDFDFSGYNVNQIVERTVIPVTGITENLEDGAISITPPDQMPSRKMTLEYNDSAKRYEVVITIDRDAGEVIWNDEGDIAYGKSVLADGYTSVLFPGDSLVIDSKVSAANGVPGLDIRVAEGGSLKLTGGQRPATLQIDEGGVYDVYGGAVVPTTLKLNGGKLINSEVTDVQPLATTLEMMANSTIEGNVAFGALTINGTGTLTINEGASIKFSAAVTKSDGSELNVANNGIITLTTGTVPAFNALSGAGYIEFAQLNAPGALQFSSLNNFSMPIHLKGISGAAHLLNTTAISNEVVIDGAVTINNGSSNAAYTFNKVSGTGAFTLSTWTGCSGLSYTISELNNFSGSLNIVNNATGNCTYSFAIGNIVTDKIVYSTPLVKLTRTISREANSIPFDISTVQLNGAETTLLMLEEDGIYHASATYNGTNYRDVNAAIDDAGADHIGEITVYDANAILTGDYIIKNVDGVLSIVPVDKMEITTNTRVSEWTGYTNERLVVDGSVSEVTVNFDAKIPEAIKEVRLVGNVKLVAEGAKVIETSKLKGMEGAKLTILSDIEGDFEVKSAIKLDNVALSHAVMTDAEIEITGKVTLAGIRASSIYAHDATLKTADGITHKFPESRTMTIAGTVVIDSTLEIATGATLTFNADSAATLKIMRSIIGGGNISYNESIDLYIPLGVEVAVSASVRGSVSGEGTFRLVGSGMNATSVDVPTINGLKDSSKWTGTFVIENWHSERSGYIFNPANYGNVNSSFVFNGYKGYIYYDIMTFKSLGVEGQGLVFNGSYRDGNDITFEAERIFGFGNIDIKLGGGNGTVRFASENIEYNGSIIADNVYRFAFVKTKEDVLPNYTTKTIVVSEKAAANIGKGKTWAATNGITINGTIKGSGTLASATTFSATSIIDVSEGNLTLGAGVTLPETINIKGAKSGSVILAGVPAGTTVPKFKLIDNPGSLELKLQSDGQLVLIGSEVTISIPELEHAHYEVFANGKPVIVQNGSITVDSGTEITVTYTPELGFVGGGSLTTTIVNGLTPIRSDLISVKQGVKVIIREYKGAKVKTIEGLDEDGIATEGVTINGNDYHPISEAVDGVLLIEIH